MATTREDLLLGLRVQSDGAGKVSQVEREVAQLMQFAGAAQQKGAQGAREATQQFGAMERGAGALTVRLRDLITTVAATAGAFIGIQTAGQAVRSLFDTGVTYDKWREQFTAFLGSTAAAEQRIRFLEELSKTADFKLPTLAQAAEQLDLFGLDTERLLPRVARAADLMGRSLEDTVNALSLATLGQTRGLKRFAIDVDAIQREAGVRLEEGGKLTVAQNKRVVDAIVRDWDTGLTDATDTIDDKAVHISNAFFRLKERIFQSALAEEVAKWLDTITDKLAAWEADGTFDRIAEKFATNVRRMATAVRDVIHFVTEFHVEIEALAAGAGFVILATKIEGFIKTLTALRVALLATNPELLLIGLAVTAAVGGFLKAKEYLADIDRMRKARDEYLGRPGGVPLGTINTRTGEGVYGALPVQGVEVTASRPSARAGLGPTSTGAGAGAPAKLQGLDDRSFAEAMAAYAAPENMREIGARLPEMWKEYGARIRESFTHGLTEGGARLAFPELDEASKEALALVDDTEQQRIALVAAGLSAEQAQRVLDFEQYQAMEDAKLQASQRFVTSAGLLYRNLVAGVQQGWMTAFAVIRQQLVNHLTHHRETNLSILAISKTVIREITRATIEGIAAEEVAQAGKNAAKAVEALAEGLFHHDPAKIAAAAKFALAAAKYSAAAGVATIGAAAFEAADIRGEQAATAAIAGGGAAASSPSSASRALSDRALGVGAPVIPQNVNITVEHNVYGTVYFGADGPREFVASIKDGLRELFAAGQIPIPASAITR